MRLRRTTATGILAFALVTPVALTGCGIGIVSSQAEPYADSGSRFACEAFTPYADLDQMQQAIASEPSILGIVGADIATSVQMPGGTIAFAFGDTFLDSAASTETTVRNALIVVDADRACLVLDHDGRAFVPDRPDGVGYWSTSLADATPPGVAVRPTMAMFLQRVSPTSDDEFTNLGPALAEVVFTDDGLPHLHQVIDIGIDNESRQKIGWGAASWRADDGNIYIYGTANPERELVFGWSLHVARVRAEDVFDVSAWQYWDGATWGEDPAAAIALIPAVGGVSQTLSVFEQDGTWYAASKQDDYLGSDVVIWSAPQPMGPFTASPSVASRPSDGTTVRYAVVAHPTLYPQEGSVVLSISQNTTDESALADDPTLYRPEFFRVPLP